MKPPPNPHYRHRFPAEIICHAVWLCRNVFSLSLRDAPSSCWLSGALSSPTRRFGAGARNSARALLAACAAAGPDTGISGTSTKCSSGSRACSIIFGAPWISTAWHSTFWFRNAAMPQKLLKRFFWRLLKGLADHAAGNRDGQTEKLRRGEAPPASRYRASTKPISEQSC